MKINSLSILLILLTISCSKDSKLDLDRLSAQRIDHPAVLTEEFIYPLNDAPTPECHASTVAVSNGVVVASWFGGTKEKNKDVGIWISRKTNDGWSKPKEIVNGVQEDGSRHPCWNPVLFKPSNGPLQLYYKVGPNPREWWGMYTESHNDGQTWSEPILLEKDILGPIKNQPIQLNDSTLLSPSSTESKKDGWKIHLEISHDLGRTWSRSKALNDPDEFGAIQPAILNYGNGKIQLLSRTENGVVTQNWSNNNGESWDAMKETGLPNPNSGIDAASLTDGKQVLIYNPTGENWGDRVPLNLATSTDGLNWKDVIALEPLTELTDKKGEEYSYPTISLAPDGLLHLVYTWNRKSVKYIVVDPKKL